MLSQLLFSQYSVISPVTMALLLGIFRKTNADTYKTDQFKIFESKIFSKVDFM